MRSFSTIPLCTRTSLLRILNCRGISLLISSRHRTRRPWKDLVRREGEAGEKGRGRRGWREGGREGREGRRGWREGGREGGREGKGREGEARRGREGLKRGREARRGREGGQEREKGAPPPLPLVRRRGGGRESEVLIGCMSIQRCIARC
jgi:hypothetical protein